MSGRCISRRSPEGTRITAANEEKKRRPLKSSEIISGSLQGGDLYVLYTKNDKQQCTVPRVAIRMENGNIGLNNLLSVNHRGFYIAVSKKLLNQADVFPAFEKMDRERMTKSMTRDPLREAFSLSCALHRVLHI